MIEDRVSPDRFQVLLKEFEKLDDPPKFDFLTIEERELLERAIALSNLQANLENGIGSVAHYSISAPGLTLRFEGDIEDDGACITLRTPYDDRDGMFVDLDNCVTESW